MTQKPMLRTEVYARVLRVGEVRLNNTTPPTYINKEDSVERAGSVILPPPSNVVTVHEVILKPD